jgi:hypothetical protein
MCYQLHLRLGNSTLPLQKTPHEVLGWVEVKRKDLSLISNKEVSEAGSRGRDPLQGKEELLPRLTKSNVLGKLSQHRLP